MKVFCSSCGSAVDLTKIDGDPSEIQCQSCRNRFRIPVEDTSDFLGAMGPSLRSAEPKSSFGRFQILEPLGIGATSQVFRARDTKHDRIVALKLFGSDPSCVSPPEHLIYQAQGGSGLKLRHPYIAPILDVGIEEGRQYIAREYVAGVSLKEWGQKYALSPPEVADICAKLADALEHAHAHQIIHRDLKPGNIIIDAFGEPHLVDFGLAVAGDVVFDAQQGWLVGTPAYMSPEQARGEAHLVDPRTDIYSLGVILYELLSGERPHSGPLPTLLRRVASEPPRPLNREDHDIPATLEAICLKCLEKDPRNRYQSAQDLAAALRGFVASEDGAADMLAEIRRLRSDNENFQRMFLGAQSEHQFYQALVEDLPLCVYRKDKEGRYQFANDVFCETVQQPFSVLKSKTSRDILPEHLAQEHERVETLVISTGKVIDSVEECAAGNEVKTFEVQRSPIRNFRGEISGVQTIMWDVSAHAKAERALREAKEAAEAANQAKSNFLANVSHEIRTPMHAIIGFTDVLLKRQQDAESERILTLIRRSANALLSIINNILDFSRIEANRLEPESVEFDLHETIDELVSLFVNEANRKGIDLFRHVADDVPRRCVGDPTRIRQALLNLLANAVKFTSKGRVSLTVQREILADGADQAEAARNDASDGSVQLHFTVSDTGDGIPEENLGSIFHPFEQVDGSVTRKHGGTGLGLAICSQVVRLMGGEIQVRSEVGKGSEFHVSLGLKAAHRHPSPDTRASAEADTGSDKLTRVRPLRVLLVEDDPINQEFALLSLRDVGHAVTVAANGHDAVEMFHRRTFDVVLMDLQMPEMDGLSAVREIRRHEGAGGSRIPIIAMTAHATEKDRERCLVEGMDGYLAKPVGRDDILKTLATIAHREAGSCESVSDDDTRRFETFDAVQLMQRVQGNTSFLRRMIAMLEEDYCKLRCEIEAALDDGNLDGLVAAAHKMQGVVRNFDATTAASALRNLEISGRNRELAAARQTWLKSRKDVDALRADLAAFVARLE